MRSFTESVLYLKQDLQGIFVCAWVCVCVCVCVCLSFYVSSEEDVCSSVGEEGEESEMWRRIVLWTWSTLQTCIYNRISWRSVST
jgi:hypothetical protein